MVYCIQDRKETKSLDEESGADNTHPEPFECRYSFEDEAGSWVKIKFCNYGECSWEGYDDFVLLMAQKSIVEFAKQMKASLMQEGLPPVASEKRN